MRGIRLISIPIFLRSRDQYYIEQKSNKDKFINGFCSNSGESPSEAMARLGTWLEERCFWPPWEFNDIVGFIVVYYDGRFYAESYKLDRKRINRDPRHRGGSIIFNGKVGEQAPTIYPPTNESLLFAFSELLSEIKGYAHKKHWYIDSQYWEDISASLNFIKFLQLRGVQNNPLF